MKKITPPDSSNAGVEMWKNSSSQGAANPVTTPTSTAAPEEISAMVCNCAREWVCASSAKARSTLGGPTTEKNVKNAAEYVSVIIRGMMRRTDYPAGH